MEWTFDTRFYGIFRCVFPRRLIEHLAEWTNAEIEDFNEHITVMDLDKYIACILAMTLQPRINMKDYWKPQNGSFRGGGNFYKWTGMSRIAFDNVRKKMLYGPKTSHDKSFDGF